jgi:hypothetical protein
MADDLFIAPTDETYAKLKTLYSFPVENLRQQFSTHAMSVCGELMTLAKQHNLIRFREVCLPHSFKLPDTLFIYDSDTLSTNPALGGVGNLDRFQLKEVVNWAPTPASSDLATIVQSTYPNTPWIVAYFVTVTFPTMFGHFLSADFAEAGLNFIKSHMRQREIVEKLLGSYLLHCFVFRDRLLEVFCQGLAVEDACDADKVRAAFFASYKASIRYLSRPHVDAILLFRNEFGEAAAAETMIEQFLAVVVQYWQTSPFLPGVTPCQRDVRGRRAAGARTCFPLKDYLLDFARRPEAARHLIDPLGDTCTSSPPNWASVVPPPLSGFRFDVSHVDEVLMLRIAGWAVVAGPPDPADEAFRLRQETKYFFAPDPTWAGTPKFTDRSLHPTTVKLEERKAYHHFCIERSGALRTLDLWLGALRRILAAQSRLLVKRQPRDSRPLQFALDQFTAWGCDLASRLNLERGVVDGVGAPTAGADAATFVRARIGECLRSNFREKKPITAAVLCAATDCISSWRVGSGKPAVTLAPDDWTFCGYFCDAVLRVTEALFCDHLSARPVPLLGRDRAEVEAELQDVLGRRERPCSFAGPLAKDECLAEALGPIRCFLTSANEIAQYSFEHGEDVWGTGDQLMFFLRIEELLNFYLTKGSQLAEWSLTHPSLMVSIFPNTDDPRGPIYIRAWLLNIVDTVHKWRNGDPALVGPLGEMGYLIFTEERLSALVRLADFFLLMPLQ